MAARCSVRHGLEKIGIHVLLLQLAVTGEDDIRDAFSPDPKDCADCVYAKFSCARPCVQEYLRAYTFDFAYYSGRCWERMPGDDNSVMLDFDVWCAEPSSKPTLNCSSMYGLPFQGLSILGSCMGSRNDSALVRESCFWECKNGRPAARCLWEFDHEGQLGLQNRLQQCWMRDRCDEGRADHQVVVDVVCKPDVGLVSKVDAAGTKKAFGELQVSSQEHQRRSEEVEEALRRAKASMAAELLIWEDKVLQEQRVHNETKADLLNLQKKLRTARDERKQLGDGFAWALVAYSFIAVAASGVAVWICRHWSIPSKLQGLVEQDTDATVVLGRPVVPTAPAEPPQSLGAGNARGKLAMAWDS
eukprot:TRINITY_DN120689_c0_g1_i1.p1 TRINITY_DN120689_c0_g1~~TRINITY_DN120689_c0_g1_i1.p1  ORF type:complete len:359 (-),score=60.62 TRINITY_DN120689_c0_g1_i1:256-1332(-)